MAGRGVTRTRFAPSPTGLLHLGHAFSAFVAAEKSSSGQFLLRIEDIDRDRCKPEFEDAIFEDLAWLGLQWRQPVMRQSERLEIYRDALSYLSDLGVTYPCSCTRGDIKGALSAPQEGVPIHGPDGLIYPGTCRGRPMRDLRDGDVIRLDTGRAFDLLRDNMLSFRDGRVHVLSRDAFLRGIGDVILARRGMGTSYHLSVVLDDAAQGIDLVTRGLDLFDSTWIHVLLQRLLDLETPEYHHHRLIRDADGKRLAKRDDARSLRALRDDGVSPAEIRAMVGM
ncbi:tRNA glutamyl-Q(34) synthetase GluQRS [Paracoccus aerodenitrificans]|uniref:tRNA glutamyl-Q(34) synthetase GluQRS n=1 Tax=Paracoccus aerodenitrificans TaxID=3017781 RepID=UPI0022F0D999|nr:tRNA glutamyl-Q(34) synthetase GluQRS [Paracoccus aerodenitrificans]WBU62881.1 tRNA glutamyl-Q(34) synthetase GluQRS [Paracoccus aerodenitrificans]